MQILKLLTADSLRNCATASKFKVADVSCATVQLKLARTCSATGCGGGFMRCVFLVLYLCRQKQAVWLKHIWCPIWWSAL